MGKQLGHENSECTFKGNLIRLSDRWQTTRFVSQGASGSKRHP
ncbi:hypothetical protein PCH70_41550 [Pseudomonas cichorii JBC1]|nr:hypothetical protein PCH70_41550 [Pseudomonas cichorii JBC1]